MDLTIINDVISDLEKEEPSVTTIQELANLYIVRDHLTPKSDMQELLEIIPQYKKYCFIKRQYQLKEVPEENLIQCIRLVCEELQDFIKLLLTDSDNETERQIITKMLQNLQIQFL